MVKQAFWAAHHTVSLMYNVFFSNYKFFVFAVFFALSGKHPFWMRIDAIKFKKRILR